MKRFLSLSFGSILAASGGYAYAKYVEPKRLDIVRKTISASNLPASFDGINVLQFSDTHLGLSYHLPQLQNLVEKMNALRPDIVLFTGDLIDIPNEYPYTNKVAPILKQIQAPLGKYSIYGNHDHGGYGTELYKEIMHQADFKLLTNEVHKIELVDQTFIHICGLDDVMLGKPEYSKTLNQLQHNVFSIAMVHEPDVAVKVANYEVDLQLSGHSHGGQIQIPFYGPLITPPFGTVYSEGSYEVGQSNMQLYVNRGLGTTRLPFRFLATPEVTIFTLRKA
ncbi:putative MPP superfamily phosphohydrolase [Bacillus iocasae]|uniref:MPP superfamily phosphohydrolase n=1 Tax=Priestia iocasae TaxID=2291674 RepID=A0ABS2R1P8_9BACI|nr:putative MPP superfamily phosphohydrolase [Metabacillus iocasae]